MGETHVIQWVLLKSGPYHSIRHEGERAFVNAREGPGHMEVARPPTHTHTHERACTRTVLYNQSTLMDPSVRWTLGN